MAVQQDACLHMAFASKARTMSKKMGKVLMEIYFAEFAVYVQITSKLD